jgi:prepilin-type N-terminal cleavage/methylation domain-containing protein
MRRVMRSHSHQSRGTLSRSRPERSGVRPFWLFKPKRSAFTLVELLVVIGILAVLAALITPAIFQARVSARNAAIKSEIDMLHMAIMNYKNEYGSFPPASGIIIKTGVNIGSDPISRHLRRLFPRIQSAGDAAIQAQCLPFLNNASSNPYAFTGANGITPDAAIVAWLFGYNSNPSFPVLSANTVTSDNSSPPTITVAGMPAPRKLLYDFDRSRITSTYNYHPSGKPGSPFIYIDAANYGTTFGDYQSVSSFNPDSFQILCAGLDEQWGTEDDLSNFWPGTRQDYLDSLE